MTRAKAPARLSAVNRLLVNAIGVGVWTSGVAWLGFHYFLVRQGQFGPERSPLEPWSLKLHGAFAFLALWLAGLLWGVHVVNGWSQGRRRWSGSMLAGLYLALILSGYLLYYAGDEGRDAISLLHWVIGLAAPALYLGHRLTERLLANYQRAAESRAPAE